ncbi:DUF2461 domain-containing protein [Sphingobacterium wenxiniae]|uniref:TIGR02453 family protein n=1 Tax=Sphingobacterium wenxiniae TaxID=683125 RepID=A0A1I6SDW6_9SPHI|nr:DUF2461 domain-containing protein [Sphingobacterium wenxiniae]SFS75152.1 TIGR02453 family protein [Sphingobacterium wenxiniae]
MKIEKQTIDFLRQLQKNNNREWFQENKESYDAAITNVKEFITELIAEFAVFDPHINTDIQASKCLFRIYRDIRFSKDKTPYKNWFAAGISIDGRKLDGPEYYLHIEPEKSFLAAGYWRPNKNHLEAIRQEIDYSTPELLKALDAGGWKVEDLSREDKLKRAPAGYAEDDPNIELLKLKSFILYQQFTDEEITDGQGLQNLVKTAERIYPFKRFIHQALEQ